MKLHFGSLFAGTMVVQPDSWHGRLYSYWTRYGQYKNGPYYRENLCHYTRVVLIWAPATWLSQSRMGQAAGRFGHWASNHIGPPLAWGCMALAYLWGAFIVGSLVWIMVLHPLVLVAMILQTIGVVAVTGLVLFGLGALGAKLFAKGSPVRDTGQLVGHVIMAKKRGICPFIEFASNDEFQTDIPVTAPAPFYLEPNVKTPALNEERVLEPV